jgi:hypothetical protein
MKAIREELLKNDIKCGLNSSIIIIYDDIFFDSNKIDSKKEDLSIKVKLIDFDYFGKENDLKDKWKDKELIKKLELSNTIDPLNKVIEIFENFKTEFI